MSVESNLTKESLPLVPPSAESRCLGRGLVPLGFYKAFDEPDPDKVKRIVYRANRFVSKHVAALALTGLIATIYLAEWTPQVQRKRLFFR